MQNQATPKMYILYAGEPKRAIAAHTEQSVLENLMVSVDTRAPQKISGLMATSIEEVPVTLNRKQRITQRLFPHIVLLVSNLLNFLKIFQSISQRAL